ncbi:CCA tRNA nucleotidyltransferase [Altericroceibacterium endophyticum]|uniref:CCA tRNA nucleotidyltransferase n=1 Tax=Altericroceibacterium endophyticum TaxID=1808508 RepID=A0A6I4T2L7_9SPHN|nr:CCA tRNA nucleotidyltransferase [Altericroceibacterium endophyticum]MXO64230.1 CCA tRNA nucleotidyltransferase [Altericroceibacterium endophyticum]
MAELPSAAWTARADLAKLIEALGPDNARWVGGAVRDTLLGHAVADVDCATPLHPDQVIERLKQAGIKSVPTGIAHGTVTAVLPQGNVEITTLRHDVSTDGRRATVSFASDWREDAARRDFTINALYADPVSGQIFDYFDGLADLSARQVRFIGDAQQRIREDHLRILRYFRFQARFGAELNSEAENACSTLAATLKGLSRERVAMELLKLLALPAPDATIRRMFQLGVLPVILPEVTEAGLAELERLMKWEASQGAEPSSLRRMAALLPPNAETAAAVASRLRLSRSQKKYLTILAERSPQDAGAPRALAFRNGKDAAIDRLLLTGADSRVLQSWENPDFPLKGGEIVSRGVAAGPDVARILQAVQNRWIAEEFPGRDRVEILLTEELGN